MKNAHKWIFGIILLTALFLRAYRISGNPPALSWDEVSIGYNAYSILKTGFDEHGKYLPLDTFIAYGDYKPPLPVYLTVPFVAFFGLTPLAVRLPSALAGTMTVFLTYVLVKELFGSTGDRKNRGRMIGVPIEWLALLSSAFLALSPWHILLSRAGFEANIAGMFLVLGVWLFLVSQRTPSVLPFAILPFVAGVYTFNSSRYVGPFLLVGVCIYLRKTVMKEWKRFLIGCVIAAAVLLPIAPHLFSKEARLRFAEVNIFSDISIVETANSRMAIDGNSVLSKIIHNRRFTYLRSYLAHYLDHFQPDYLFIKGDGNPKFSVQDVGQLYLIDAPFLIVGIFLLYSFNPSLCLFLLYWIAVSIIPAASARETPHALRTENSLPVWQIITAFGLLGSVAAMKLDRVKHAARRGIIFVTAAGIAVLYVFNVSYFLHTYFMHYPKEYSGEWQYGYGDALSYVSTVSDMYEHIVITDSIGRPYMYTAFYCSYDPTTFRKEKKSYFDAAGFYHVDSFGKFSFVKNAPSVFVPKTLYVLDPSFVPEGAIVRKTVQLLNGTPVLVVFDMGGSE